MPSHSQLRYQVILICLACVVVKNQEAHNALETYTNTFDIKVFPREIVPIACVCLKAVAQALGDKCLPTNTICKVLEGFMKSLTDSFNAFFASQIALRRGSFYCNLMQSTSLQQQLHNVLNNLEATYLGLVGGKLWAGVTASPQGSSFVGVTTKNDEIAQACAMVAMKDLPWDEWVKKYTKYHHRSEQGHIRSNFPTYLDKIKSGKIKRGGTRPSPFDPPKACPPGRPAQQCDFMKDPKVKAFFSAFQALFISDEGVDDNNDALAKANNAAHD